MVTCVTFRQFLINSQQMVENRQWNRERRQQLPRTKFRRKHRGQGRWGERGQYTQLWRNGRQEGDFEYVFFITCHSADQSNFSHLLQIIQLPTMERIEEILIGIQASRRRRLILFSANSTQSLLSSLSSQPVPTSSKHYQDIYPTPLRPSSLNLNCFS